MAVAFRSAGALASSGSGTPTVAYPAGVASGDLLVIQMSAASTAVTPNTPAGWTKLFGPVGMSGGGNVVQAYVFYKIAGGSEPASITFVNPGTSSFAAGIMIAYTGADGTTPINTSATANLLTTGTTGTTPSVTTTVANAMLLRLYWDWSSAATVTPAGTDTERYDSFESNLNIAHELADSTQAAAGASGTTTATFSTATSGGLAATIAIAPPGSGGGGNLTASEQLSGGFVRDLAGRLVNVASGGGNLTAAEQISGGFVRDQAGRLMTISSAGGALTAQEQLSGGFVRDPQGRLVISSGAATGYSGGFQRDQAGRLVVSTASGALGAGEAFSGGFVRDANGLLSLVSTAPAAPVNTSVPTISGTAQQDQTLTASPGGWTGSPTPTFTYQWQQDGTTNVPGATSSTYVVQASDVGHTLRVVVTGANGSGSVPANSAQTASVLPAAPANTAVPTITGTAQQGQTLSSSQGSWTNSPTGYTYAWQTSPTGVGSWVNIGGATASTYAVVVGDVGNYLRVQVTAANTGGSSAPSSSAATAQVTASANYAATVMADSPTYYWRLGEPSGTAAADSADANGGTYNGMTLAQTGVGNTGDTSISAAGGTTAWIATPVATVENAQVKKSFEFWFKCSVGCGLIGTVAGASGSTASGSGIAGIYIDSNNKLCYYFWRGAQMLVVSPGVVNDGAWHHAVITTDPAINGSAGATLIYLDGAQVATSTVSDWQANAGDSYLIGAIPAGLPNAPAQRSLSGNLSEVAIWHGTILSAARVLAHYNAGH